MEQPQVNVLVVDIGGTHVKVMATGRDAEVKIDSGPTMSPAMMVKQVKAATKGWEYDAVSIGYPGPVMRGKPLRDPFHLAPGWLRFDYEKAFGKPVKLMNDAAMQALGSYTSGRMLFLGLGTGLGAAVIEDQHVEPLELAHLPYKKGRSYEDYLGNVGLVRLGRKKWEKHVFAVAELFLKALVCDSVVIGGGNARKLGTLPARVRLGDNANAFKGGYGVWGLNDATDLRGSS
jgi:polyphosphate glucokinase